MSQEKVTIRRASEGDLETILTFNQALFESNGEFDRELDFSFPQSPLGREYFRSRIRADDSIALIATTEEGTIGYLVGGEVVGESYRQVATLGEVENMLVSSRVQNSGVGSKLMAEFLTWCKQRGLKRAKVSAYSENIDAVRFYERRGFRKLSVTLEMEL